MSIPPQGTQGSKVMEDCRDYLRTGRCKYGASCKYNHPPNVQNGGGIQPVDPSEPLFPSRPNEPVCQYFLKHGTCKFGQACKFDHPPQHSVHVMNGGQMQVMTVGRMSEQPQLVLNPIGNDANGMVLQFLPQRVDEPDCIYFLKNRRCKYGATCRYHHPIHSQQTTGRLIESKPRRQPDPYNRAGQKVQYVTQMVPSYSNQGGQQVLMSYDNSPVTFVNMDGTSGSTQSYQIIAGSDGVASYCVPTGSVVVTEKGSSASSIASSSYETAHEHLGDQWSGARRNGSGGSLSAYTNDGRQQRVFLSHSASEGNMVQRQPRTTSYGSAGEMGSAGLPRNGSAGSWNQRMQGSQYLSRQEPNNRSPVISSVQRRMMRRRDPRGGEGPDEGFTMMTSALLHMLDTPEEVTAESYSDDEYRHHVAEQYRERDQVDYDLFERMSLQDASVSYEARLHGDAPSFVDPIRFEQMSVHAPYTSANQLSPPSATDGEAGSSWSPTWLGAVQGPEDDSADAFSLLHHHKSQAPASTSSHDSDVGLYLP